MDIEDGISTQEIIDELERIRAQHSGRLNTADVVDAARPEDAILHPAFEWDDRIAGELYRRTCARHLIANIRVQKEGNREPVRMYVNIKMEDSARHYIPSEEAMADPDLRAQVLAGLRRSLNYYAAELRKMEGLAHVLAHVESLMHDLEPID